MVKEYIICAAIQLIESGKIYYGHRHPHCIKAMNGELSWTMNRQQICKVEKEQGFVTSTGRFVGRKEAFQIACINNQISEEVNLVNKTDLYSEDLY